MAKFKKQADGTHVAHDDITGEPLAIVSSSGSGSRKSVEAKWHPHVLAIHPEAASILSRIPTGHSMDNAGYLIDNRFANILNRQKHEFDVKKDPTPVVVKGSYGSDETHHVFHFHDKETGNKILSISTRTPAKLGSGETYYDTAKLRAQHIGTPENLSSAMKKAGFSGAEHNLERWTQIASNLKKTVSTGGPRFVGTESAKVGSSSKKYKTTIADPTAAITDYAKEAIPNKDKLVHIAAAPDMHIFRSLDGNESHVISFKDGHVHHISNKLSASSYDKTPLNHVIESA